MDPLIGGALIGAGASMLGGFMNLSGVNSANRANRKLQQEQNEWNERMWEKQNAYNDPSAQMARLQKAGINPNMAFSNGLSNVAASTPPTTSPPTMQSYQGWNQDLSSAVATAMNGILLSDQHKMNKIQLDKANIEMMHESAKRLETLAKTEGVKINNRLQQRIQDDLVKYHQNQQILLGKQAQLSEAQYYTEIMKQTLSEQELINFGATLKKIQSETNLNNLRVGREKAETERALIAKRRDQLEYELNQRGFSTSDPLYANVLRQMVDDPDYLNTMILSIESLKGIGDIAGKIMGKGKVDLSRIGKK